MIGGRRLPVTWYWPAVLAVVDVMRHVSMGESAGGGEARFPGHGITSTEQGENCS